MHTITIEYEENNCLARLADKKNPLLLLNLEEIFNRFLSRKGTSHGDFLFINYEKQGSKIVSTKVYIIELKNTKLKRKDLPDLLKNFKEKIYRTIDTLLDRIDKRLTQNVVGKNIKVHAFLVVPEITLNLILKDYASLAKSQLFKTAFLRKEFPNVRLERIGVAPCGSAIDKEALPI